MNGLSEVFKMLFPCTTIKISFCQVFKFFLTLFNVIKVPDIKQQKVIECKLRI